MSFLEFALHFVSTFLFESLTSFVLSFMYGFLLNKLISNYIHYRFPSGNKEEERGFSGLPQRKPFQMCTVEQTIWLRLLFYILQINAYITII